MATGPESSLPEKLKVNLLFLLLLILSLAGVRLWSEKEAGAVPYPYWLAVSDDGIAILYGKLIYVSDSNGTPVKTMEIPDRILPCQLTWHNSSLLVSDWRNDAVHLFGPDGISSLSLQGGPNINAHMNAVIDEGQKAIYVTDSEGNRVHTYDREGRYLRSFGKGASGKISRVRGTLSSPKDIRFRNELLYVGNVLRSGVDIFSTDGTFIKPAVEPQGVWLNNLITDFDVAEDRIATIECNALFEDCRMAVYDGSGALLKEIPHTSGSESVGDIALWRGIVYASDTLNRTVIRYDAGTLDELGPVSTELNAIGERDNERSRKWKGYSQASLLALILCCLPLAFLYRQYRGSQQKTGGGQAAQ